MTWEQIMTANRARKRANRARAAADGPSYTAAHYTDARGAGNPAILLTAVHSMAPASPGSPTVHHNTIAPPAIADSDGDERAPGPSTVSGPNRAFRRDGIDAVLAGNLPEYRAGVLQIVGRSRLLNYHRFKQLERSVCSDTVRMTP